MNFKQVKITYKPFLIFLLIYTLIRLIIFNINVAEWGDTYRMVRAAEFLSVGEWPWDEKRWPMFSLLLVPGIYLGIPILWGKVLVLLSSLATFVVQFDFFKRFVAKNNQLALISVVMTAVSPVFAYWSFRVMADPFFTFISIFSFYLYYLWHKNLTNKRIYILSFLLLMCTMTRLEGLFVIGAIGIVELVKILKHRSKKNILNFVRLVVIFSLPQFFIYLPFTLYAKVFYEGFVHNDYIAEVKTFFSFDMDRIRYFFAYDLFFYGIPFAFIFILKSVFSKDLRLLAVYLFILFETVLGFIWTPSLPRIHMPLIPFFSMLFVYGVYKYDFKFKDLTLSGVLVGVFLWLQFKYKLYFLNLSYIGFFLVLLLSGLALLSLYAKQSKKLLFYFTVLAMFTTSIVVIANETNNYKTIVNASNYAVSVGNKIGYSDESGVSEYLLDEKGFYLDKYKYIHVMSHGAQWEWVLENKPDYLITTNGFEKNSKLDLQETDEYKNYLELVYESEYELNDVFDVYLEKLGVVERNSFIFRTQVWRVKYEDIKT